LKAQVDEVGPSRSCQRIEAASFSFLWTARNWAAHHANFLGLPVDLRIVFLEPGVTEDDMLLPESGYSELDALGVPFVVDHHIDYASDAARLVQTAVHVENQDGL
jgi:hypothetical protein